MIRCCRTKIQLCILLSFYPCMFTPSGHYQCWDLGDPRSKPGACSSSLPTQAEQRGKANTDAGSGASVPDTGAEPPFSTAVSAAPVKNLCKNLTRTTLQSVLQGSHYADVLARSQTSPFVPFRSTGAQFNCSS